MNFVISLLLWEGHLNENGMVIVIVMVEYNFYNFYNFTSPCPYYYNNFDIGKVLRGIIETSIFLLHPQPDLPICICLSGISQFHDSLIALLSVHKYLMEQV